MIDFFDSLPEWAKVRMSEPPGYKHWKLCASCGVSHRLARLRVCAGCAECRREPIYYCSKKCQKNNWNSHKDSCAAYAASGKYAYFDSPDENISKSICRWERIHHQLLYSAFLNVYHYNPHLNPRLTFVAFFLEPRSMQIREVSVKRRDLQKAFLEEITKSTTYDHPFYYVISVPPTPSSVGYSDIFPLGDGSKLDTPETRKTILGCPQWPWVAAYITREPPPSPIVTTKKLTILVEAITAHLELDADFLGPEFAFNGYNSSCQIEISKDQMSRFCARLQSVNLWSPLLRKADPDSPVLYLAYLLDYIDSYHASKKRRQG